MTGKLFITGWRYMAVDETMRPVAAPKAPPVFDDYIEVGLESVQSDPFPNHTLFIEVLAETNCALAFGRDPTATPDRHPILAGERRWYGVEIGDCIAVIQR
jgi:hypothetical protein